MAEISTGDIQLKKGKSAGGQRQQGTFKIAVLGDFSANQSVPAFKSYRVDRDDFDELIEKIKPKLNLSFEDAGADSIELSFSDLDDFHPDHLFSEVSLFRKLRNTRKKLQNRNTFDEAAAQVYQWLGEPKTNEIEPKKQVEVAQQQKGEMNLDDVLNATLQQSDSESGSSKGSSGESRLDESKLNQSRMARSLIAKVIGPYVIPKSDPRVAELTEAVDLAIANLMRLILHHPAFVALEASWLSLYSMVKEIETDSKLVVDIWSVSFSDLVADLSTDDDLTKSHFYKKTVQETIQTAGASPYNLMLGLYQIQDNEEACATLGRLANICAQSKTAFITNADWSLLGVENPCRKVETDDFLSALKQGCPLANTQWASLRSLAASEFLGLTFPRYAIRYPYGRKSSPIETFQFQELMEQEEHQGIAWGFGCVAVGILLAKSFREIGKQFSPGEISTFQKVPTLLVEDEGETITYPQAEFWMHESLAESISELGLIPIWSIKNDEGVFVRPFDSFHVNRNTIKGGW